MKKRVYQITVLVTVSFAFLFVYSCATIVHGTTQSIGITSTPDGATIIIDGEQQPSKTPANVNLKRKKNHIVQLNKEGFVPDSRSITKKASGWMVGNILLGGIIGLFVDLGTGGGFNLNPENLHFDLKSAPKEIQPEKEPVLPEEEPNS